MTGQSRRVLVLLLAALLSSPATATTPNGLIAVASLKPGICVRPGESREAAFVAPLAAIVIPALVKVGISALGASIQSAASDASSPPLVAMANDSFYTAMRPAEDGPPAKIEATLACFGVLVTSAKAASADPNGKEWTRWAGEESPPAETIFNELKSVSLGRRHLPHLLSTWKIEYSADRSAFRLHADRVIIGPAITDQGLRSRRRDLVLTLGMHLPSVNETDGAIGSATLMIPAIDGPQALAGPEAAYLGTRWWPMPGLPAEAAGQLKSILQRQEDLRALEDDIADPANAGKLPSLNARKQRLIDRNNQAVKDFTRTGALAPITMRASVTETRQGSKLIAAIGKAIADQSEAVSTAVVNRLDPAKRLEASLSEFDKETDARLEAIAAIEAWQASLVEGKGVESALFKAQRRCARAQDELKYYVSQCTSLPGGS